MASFSRCFLLSLLLCSILFINQTARCEDLDEEDNLLQGINRYRASLNLSALIENDKAECLADEMADQFKGQPCTNSTGSSTVPGTEPQFVQYPRLLAKCDLNVTNRRDGIILPACVPNLVSSLVLSNFTMSQYSQYFNNSQYTGVGIGTEDNWTVVVLTTNTPQGSFAPANETDDDADDEADEDDILFRGINNFRTTLKLSPLLDNEKAECLADKIADSFDNQPCNATLTGAYTPESPQFLAYRNHLRECGLDINTTRAGVVMPACVPNLVPNLVVSNYTMSLEYAKYLEDPKFTGIGIGTEDDWMVVVLTTNTTEGSFMAASSIGGTGVASPAAELIAPVLSHYMILLVGLLAILVQ